MRYLWLFISLCLLQSCGGGGAERVEQTVVKEVTKGAVRFFGRAMNFEAPPLETYLAWAYFYANAGGLFIFVGFIMLWFMTDKRKGGRMMLLGLSLVVLAKVVEISKVVIDDWTGVLLLILAVLTVIFLFIHYVEQVEKLLAKIGIRWDLNGDGDIGTSSHEKETDIFDDDETELIPARSHA